MEETLFQGSPKRIAVVTGANKGIGLEICRQLSSRGVIVVLTARDVKRGTEAVHKLKSSGVPDVVFHQLDVADPSSVASLADFIKTHFGKLDILVNNAAVGGITLDPEHQTSIQGQVGAGRFLTPIETYKDAEECLNINYYGIKRVTDALCPLLQLAQSPKIVNVSSSYGQLMVITNESIKKELGDVDGMTEERLDEILKAFLRDFKEEMLEANGWPTRLSAYKVSKVAVSTYTRILTKRHPAICINCVDPGFVKTDINWNTGSLTVEEGAKGPVMLALLPDDSPSGLFYDGTKVSSFE